MVSKKKRKADWIESKFKFFKQIIITIKSIITLPIFKKKNSAIKDFFYNNYNVKKDEYIWDSNSNNYLNQILFNIEKDYLDDTKILDSGCGTGKFYEWLKDQNIKFRCYVGIDFAIKDSDLSMNAKLVNSDLKDYDYSKYNLFIFINVFCYLNDIELQQVFEKIPLESKLIIIEPSPNLFWDKHFNNIKPNYRKLSNMLKRLYNFNFKINSISEDYFFKIINFYFSHASYCICAYN